MLINIKKENQKHNIVPATQQRMKSYIQKLSEIRISLDDDAKKISTLIL